MSAQRVMTDGDYRTEVRRVRQALKRLAKSANKAAAAIAILEIVTEANIKLRDVRDSYAE